jgi:hypothetical protein
MRGLYNDKVLETGLLEDRDQEEEITRMFARIDSRLCERDLLDLLSLQDVQMRVRQGAPSATPDFRLSMSKLWSYWPARNAMVLSAICGCTIGVLISWTVFVPILFMCASSEGRP